MVAETLDEGGYVVLYTVFGIFLVSSLGMAFVSHRLPGSRPIEDRMHYYVTYAIMVVATIAYFTMATGGGSTQVLVTGTTYRELQYARYMDWLITTPLLLLDLVLLGIPTFEITSRIIFYDVLMILTGLFGALSDGWSKWGWYSFGCLFMVLVFWDLAVTIRRGVYAKSKSLGGLYDGLASLLILVWLLYPVVWAFGEGMNLISADAEVACYGILDVAAKVVFGWTLILRLGGSPPSGKAESSGTP